MDLKVFDGFTLADIEFFRKWMDPKCWKIDDWELYAYRYMGMGWHQEIYTKVIDDIRQYKWTFAGECDKELKDFPITD